MGEHDPVIAELVGQARVQLGAPRGVADGNPWIMNGEYAVDIKNIADDREAKRKAKA